MQWVTFLAWCLGCAIFLLVCDDTIVKAVLVNAFILRSEQGHTACISHLMDNLLYGIVSNEETEVSGFLGISFGEFAAYNR